MIVSPSDRARTSTSLPYLCRRFRRAENVSPGDISRTCCSHTSRQGRAANWTFQSTSRRPDSQRSPRRTGVNPTTWRSGRSVSPPPSAHACGLAVLAALDAVDPLPHQHERSPRSVMPTMGATGVRGNSPGTAVSPAVPNTAWGGEVRVYRKGTPFLKGSPESAHRETQCLSDPGAPP
jgi:hypothetical protein